jgi:hypothetical protein
MHQLVNVILSCVRAHKLDKMLPTVGLHVSQPIAFLSTPTTLITSLNVRNFLILITLKRSIRAIEKWGQRLLLKIRPDFFISVLNIEVTCESGLQL